MEVQDYYNFKANGLNDRLTEAEKQHIKAINEKISLYKKELAWTEDKISRILNNQSIYFTTANGNTYSRKKLAIDVDYSLSDLADIFSNKNQNIWFINKQGKLCIISESSIVNNTIYIKVFFDVNSKNYNTRMSLNRFLSLIETGDFRISSKKFIEKYLQPIEKSQSLARLTALKEEVLKNINEITSSEDYIKYSNLYSTENVKADEEMKKIRKEESRDVKPEAPVLKVKKKYDKKLADVKTIWNSTITEDEKAELIGWFTRHIIKMRIKVVDGGVSDKVISKAYPDEIYGPKYREKANSSGWDAASGIILVDSTEDAPIETIKKLSTIKHMQHSKDKGETIFKGHTIHNLDLVLFLLSKYNKYGFKTGEKLNIDFLRLAKEEFNNNTAFAQGVIGC